MIINDLQAPKCRVIKNFISKEECNWLINYSEKSGLWSKHNRQRHTFKTEEDYKSAAEHWDNRRIEINELYREGMGKYKDLFKFVVPIQEPTFFNIIGKSFGPKIIIATAITIKISNQPIVGM